MISPRSTALIALAAMLASPALAQDPRLVERLYNPDEVVVIQGKTKVQATIEFGEGESIENVAIGDSNAWQVTPNQRANLLFVKPLSPSAQTNMTVVTNRHTYLFDLVASPRAKPLYMMRFTYPEPPPEEAEPQLAENAVGEANAIELMAATDPLAVIDPAMLNFKWQAKGEHAQGPLVALAQGLKIDLGSVQEQKDDKSHFGNDMQKAFSIGSRHQPGLGHQVAEADEEDRRCQDALRQCPGQQRVADREQRQKQQAGCHETVSPSNAVTLGQRELPSQIIMR